MRQKYHGLLLPLLLSAGEQQQDEQDVAEYGHVIKVRSLSLHNFRRRLVIVPFDIANIIYVMVLSLSVQMSTPASSLMYPCFS